MNRILSILLILSLAASSAMAQGGLPEKFMFMGGGGLSISGSERPDMDAETHAKFGYTLMGDARFYLSPVVSLGLRYDYMQTGRHTEAHNFGPEIGFTFRQNDNKSAGTLLLGLGCMNYKEHLRGTNGMKISSQGDYFFSAFIGGEYDFHLGGICSGAIYATFHAADLFVNPDFRIANPDPYYDDGEYHGFFDCRKAFLNIGLALCLGH